MKRRNKSVRSVMLSAWLSGFVFLSAMGVAAIDQKDSVPGKSEEEIKPLIVMIRSKLPDGEEVGAGIIFGQAANRLYIMTANHVVRQGAQESKDVQVQFHWMPGDFEAQLLSDSSREMDWAVLAVGNLDKLGLPPGGLPFAKLGDPNSLKRKDKVYLIGNPTGHSWDITVTPDGVTGSDGNSILFESVHLAPGHSGGALLDENWRVVGLIKSSQAQHGEALNIQSLLETLKKRRYPVNLETENDKLAAKGQAIAYQDPLAVMLRNQQSAGLMRRGFDIGMAVAEGHTLVGPEKEKFGETLSPTERQGFKIAVDFSVERNYNADLAARGAAIANQDGDVAAARSLDPNVFYRLGFDIATGIFGDPAKGGRGNTQTGPGSLKIRSTLSVAGQRGFDASVAFHLKRDYKVRK